MRLGNRNDYIAIPELQHYLKTLEAFNTLLRINIVRKKDWQ